MACLTWVDAEAVSGVFGGRTLLQETAVRVNGPGFPPPVTVAHEAHQFLVADQLDALAGGRGPIVLEPIGRNTAAVAVLVSLLVARKDPSGIILLLPSDHLIKDAKHFQLLVREAVPAVQAGWICLFGIPPNRPETGYGYIESSNEAVPDPNSPVRRVASFIEKPDPATAERLVSAGDYLWKSGMFLFSAKSMLEEAEERRPDLVARTREALEAGASDGASISLDRAAFEMTESMSLDYAIMEASTRTAVLRAAIDWNDLGAWDAIYDAHHKDAQDNVLLGRAVAYDTSGSLIRSDRHLVTTVGVRNVVVVATDDAVLVADRSYAQWVKQALDLVTSRGFEEAGRHSEAHRPWGTYRLIVSGERFQVKVITVKPGGRLSLQLHRHRAEHWVVVKGSAK